MKLETGKTYKCFPKPGTKPRYGRINAFQYHPMGLGVDPAKVIVKINGQDQQRQSDKTIFVGVANGDQFEIVDQIAEPQLSEFFNYVEADVATPVFMKDGEMHNAFPKANAPKPFAGVASYVFDPADPGATYEINGKDVKQPTDKPVVLYGESATELGDPPCLGFCSEADFANWFDLAQTDFQK